MPEKILVVDDVPVNVKLLGDLLTVKGYNVVTASNGAEALATIEKERPGLVLLDVMMPGMSGYDVCRKIRENPVTAMLPVVMVTALDPTQERVKGKSSAPASIPFTRSCVGSSAVTMTTGSIAVTGFSRIFRQTS